MLKKDLSFKAILFGFRKQRISMQRRFVLCLIIFLFFIITAMLVLFSLFNITNSTDDEFEQYFDQQLDHSINQIHKNMDKLAVCAVDFSHQLSSQIENFNTPFAKLSNNVAALTALQQKTYETVLENMRIADCSGAFFILNTTVNNSLDDTYYSGIYLKYANVGSDMMLRNSVCMFRGASNVARQNGISLFSTWEYEIKQGTFPQMEAVLEQMESDPSKGYLLTKAYKLPDAWEKVRLLCTPISDKDGNIIGVCGFEISDPFFYAAYQVYDTEHKFIVCALLEQENGIYTGQLAPNSSGYVPNLKGELSIANGDPFSLFSNSQITLIGKARDLRIGSSEHTVAIMMSEKQYGILVDKELSKTITLLILIFALSIAVSVILSRRYIKPLLNTVECVKAKQFDDGAHISEFTDLFVYLAEQDRTNEEELNRLRREKAAVISDADELQSKFNEAKMQNERLAYSRKDEIDPYDYENFKNGLKMLTRKEQEVFNYYLQGKTVKEIIALLGLQESTVRFHNKNIYSKLGVHSLKQLLRYAAVLKQEEETEKQHQPSELK